MPCFESIQKISPMLTRGILIFDSENMPALLLSECQGCNSLLQDFVIIFFYLDLALSLYLYLFLCFVSDAVYSTSLYAVSLRDREEDI